MIWEKLKISSCTCRSSSNAAEVVVVVLEVVTMMVVVYSRREDHGNIPSTPRCQLEALCQKKLWATITKIYIRTIGKTLRTTVENLMDGLKYAKW